MLTRISSGKFATILTTACILCLCICTFYLMFKVRTLYQDHLKLSRLQVYKNELDLIQSHFSNLRDDIEQVSKDFQQTYKVSSDN